MPSNNLPKKHYTECKKQFKVHRNKTVWDLAQHWLQTGLCEPFEAYLLYTGAFNHSGIHL